MEFSNTLQNQAKGRMEWLVAQTRFKDVKSPLVVGDLSAEETVVF